MTVEKTLTWDHLLEALQSHPPDPQAWAELVERVRGCARKALLGQGNPRLEAVDDVTQVLLAKMASPGGLLLGTGQRLHPEPPGLQCARPAIPHPRHQVGAKVTVNEETRGVEDIFTATRPVLPGPASGCLHCHQLIPPSRLREEALTEGERRAQRYVDDDKVSEPSVIALNVLSAGQAVNDLMMMFTGLYREQVSLCHQLNFVRDRCLSTVEPMVDDQCLDCGAGPKSRRARGDKARLPCRMPPATGRKGRNATFA